MGVVFKMFSMFSVFFIILAGTTKITVLPAWELNYGDIDCLLKYFCGILKAARPSAAGQGPGQVNPGQILGVISFACSLT